MPLPSWATFPSPVNELAARTVAAGVVVLTAVTLVVGLVAPDAPAATVLAALLALGFAARTLAGPRFSLLGRLATRVVAPRLGVPRFVPGPPKRFAQAVGLGFSLAATLAYGVGPAGAGGLIGSVLLAVLLVFATLESALGFCAGCRVFAVLMRTGLIPEDVCLECADLGRRPRATAG